MEIGTGNGREAQRYDRLFQSVLCGIIQYRFDGRDKIRFENVNREALRILGYSAAEFWAVEEWSLAEVAAGDYQQMFRVLTALDRVGDCRPFEFPVLQKDGSFCWIMGKAECIQKSADGSIFQSVFMDVDEKKRTESRNRQLAEMAQARSEALNLALEHTSLCEFYYYPQDGECIHPPRTCARYGWDARYTDMPDSFARQQILPAHRSAFCAMYEDIGRGKRAVSALFCTVDGKWCRVTMSLAGETPDGKPETVVGIIEDITKEQEMELALKEAQDRDGVTGLWNREAGERMARELLRDRDPGECCAMLLLDMDDFTRINEQEGVAFANAVLQEVADCLRAESGVEDLLIRLGGDEFMVMAANCDKRRAELIGRRISGRVEGLLGGGGKGISVSVSIGICTTAVRKDYEGLFRCAESALKYAKERRPGGAACYLDASEEAGAQLTELYTEAHWISRIDEEDRERGENMISFALDLLGKAKNMEDAILLLFARIGKTYRLDRVSFLEINPEYMSGRFAYQWARHRADLRNQKVFYITQARYRELESLYTAEELHEGETGMEGYQLPGCISAAIVNHGVYSGSLSFERREDGEWTREVKKLLSELAKVISSFVLKTKADAVSRAKTDFLSRMSHEIRTPMNAIMGMTTIAKSVAGDREKVLECLEKLEGANRYLLDLVNDILDMSRIESGKLELSPESMDLEQCLSSLAELMRPQADQKDISLWVENGYINKRFLIADKLRLEQVLVNIIGNAVKFTQRGGKVCVAVIPEAFDGESVTLTFSVKDNGIGIQPKARETIFNAFEQAEKSTTRQYGGTGLGLAISSRLVRMMGGKLEVKSEPGAGSEFFFTVTFAYGEKMEPEGAAGRKPSAGAYDFSGRRLLLVEDNDLNLEIAQTLLEMQGFAVETAMDGRQALDAYGEHPPFYYDGVLMDIRMPVMDGIEAAKRIRTMERTDSPTIPIIAMTANAFDEDSRKSLESGMNGHLTKPICLDILLETLKSCLGPRTGPGPSADE